MLTIPQDLVQSPHFVSTELPQATLTAYRAQERLVSEQVLVTQPTIVLICSGVKQLASTQSDEVFTAEEGDLIALRSGLHLMSEFRAEGDYFQSWVISFERGFLRQAIGVPRDPWKEGPRVAVSSLNPEVSDRLLEIPVSIAQHLSEGEREFSLREFIVTAMRDRDVRNLLYNEVAVWGTTIEERISSVVSTHCLSPVRIEDLASLSAMSLASFKRHFKAIYDMSPGKWLQHTRLQHAHTLALNTKLPVSEICEASGYQDLSGFTRAFHRRFGRTPTSVRLV